MLVLVQKCHHNGYLLVQSSFSNYNLSSLSFVLITIPSSNCDEVTVLLTLSWKWSLLFRNQSIDLLCKSMDWFLHNGLRHERVKLTFVVHVLKQISLKSCFILLLYCGQVNKKNGCFVCLFAFKAFSMFFFNKETSVNVKNSKINHNVKTSSFKPHKIIMRMCCMITGHSWYVLLYLLEPFATQIWHFKWMAECENSF